MAAAIVLSLTGCSEQTQARSAFTIEAVTCGAGPVGRNDVIVLRFSRSLGNPLPSRAIHITDDSGNVVEAEIEADGRHLVVHPPVVPTEGGVRLWPAVAELHLRVPVPLAGPTFRSFDGEELDRGFEARVALRSNLTRRPGTLSLLSASPADGEQGIRMDQRIELTFDGPLDPASLDAGLQVVDRSQRRIIDAPAQLDPRDARRAIVHPFEVRDIAGRGQSIFNADTSYEVLITPSLESRDGRAFPERRALSFRTAAEGTHILRVGFDAGSDFDEACRRCFDPRAAALRPHLDRTFVTSRGDGPSELVSLFREMREVVAADRPIDGNRVPHLFSQKPGRTQILIPAGWAHDVRTGARPLWVHGVRFAATEMPPPDLEAEGLQLTVGYLNRELVAQGLGTDLDLNLVDGHVIPLDRSHGRTSLRGHRPLERDRQLHVSFQTPFRWDQPDRDLVLDLRNTGGVRSALYGPESIGADILGTARREAGRKVLALAQPEGAGLSRALLTSDFTVALALEVYVETPAVTRWYVVEDVEHPRFLAESVLAFGTAELGRDFRVEFQSGRPVTASEDRPTPGPIIPTSGVPECEPTGPWLPVPPSDGSPAIRVRVLFHEAWYPSGRSAPEIEYLLLSYIGSPR